MRRTSVEVEIVGGLGNQLFGLAAGLYLSQKTSSPLKLNLNQVGVGGTDHGKSIMAFNIPESYFDTSNQSSPKNKFGRRLSNKIAREFPAYKWLRDSVNKIYSASELGYESQFATLNEPRYLKGYFQTHIYADVVKATLREFLVLKSESDWYKDKLKEIEKNQPIAIQIRRGDYVNLKEDFGVLDIQYYVDTTKSLVEKNRPIWIFTDSPSLVQTEIQGTPLHEAEIVKPPVGSSPNESMLLISKCKTIVMSNSTFSWWASYLSSQDTLIYAPSKWFKGRKDPVDLIPPGWSSAESIWQNTGGDERQ